MDLVERLKHFERGGTVENPKALLREAIAEIESLRFSYAHAGDHMCDECWHNDPEADEMPDIRGAWSR